MHKVKFLGSILIIIVSFAISAIIWLLLDLKKNRKIFEHIFEHVFESIIITDANNLIIYVNKSFEQSTGYIRQEVLGKNPKILNSGKQNKAFYEKMWYSLIETNHWEGELYSRRKDGSVYPEWLSINVIKDSSKKIICYIGIFTDITSKVASDKLIREYAYHDPLTKLANRRFFKIQLKNAIALAKRKNRFVAILFIDLDYFKQINDQHGHAIGDKFLKAVALHIKKHLRKTDLLARIGGDEFLILIPDIESEDSITTTVNNIFNTCNNQLIKIKDLNLPLKASIGVSVYPKDSEHEKVLIEQADKAMYYIKQHSRNAWAYWNADLDVTIKK